MCRLHGFISKDKKAFDYSAFCTLGIHGSRENGGDSVGIFIDGKSEYYCTGTKGGSSFETFMTKSKLLEETTEFNVAYCHNRLASVGSISEKNAQPVIFYKDDNVTPDYVLMHNGTIYNYEDLAKKYIPNIDITNMTDSQVMAHIFYYNPEGYNALSEYNGGAVFVIIDYREETPRFLFWQGASKSYSTSATETTERDLHFCLNSEKGELAFATNGLFLPALFKGFEFFVIEPNTLVEFYNNDIYEVAKFDRSKCQQNKITTTTTVYYPSNHTRYGYGSSYNSTSTSATSTSAYVNNEKDRVQGNLKTGVCKIDGVRMHGHYKVSDYGRLVADSESTQYNDMWFWYGILLKNSKCFQWLESFAAGLSATPAELTEWYEELIMFMSPYPYLEMKFNNGTEEMQKIISPIGGNPAFTGSLIFPFTRAKMNFVKGIKGTTEQVPLNDSLEAYHAHKNDELDYEYLLKV